MSVHKDGGTGDDLWTDLLFPVYATAAGPGNSAAEPGMLEIGCAREPCFVPLRSYTARRAYRKAIWAVFLVAAVAVCGAAIGVAFFTIGNDGNPFRADTMDGPWYVWQVGLVAASIRLFGAALLVLLILFAVRAAHRSALVEMSVSVPEALLVPLRSAVAELRQLQKRMREQQSARYHPGVLGAKHAGAGGDLVAILIEAAYDAPANRRRANHLAQARRRLAEALLCEVERFGARRMTVTDRQFRGLDP